MQKNAPTCETLTLLQFLLKIVENSDFMIIICFRSSGKKKDLLSYAIFSVLMSKIKNRIKITQCHHIQSFSRGHPGGFNSDSVSLIHCKVRVGGPTKK